PRGSHRMDRIPPSAPRDCRCRGKATEDIVSREFDYFYCQASRSLEFSMWSVAAVSSWRRNVYGTSTALSFATPNVIPSYNFLILASLCRLRYVWTRTSHALTLSSLGSQQVSMR